MFGLPVSEPARAGAAVSGNRGSMPGAHASPAVHRGIVWRSSANLRSCRNVEQFDFTCDRQLWAFDAGVIAEMYDAAAKAQQAGDEAPDAEQEGED